MRILFLCQYFPPEMGAPAARTFEHAREWVRAGHQVTVVCGKPNHPDGVIAPKYRGPLLYREEIEGITVLRCWLYATPNRGVVRRSISFLSFMVSSMFFAAFFSGRCDVVIATSPQLLCAVSGWAASIMKWRPFVFEVRDLWPKQIIDLGLVKNRGIIALLRFAEMFLYRRASAVVLVAPATLEEVAGRGVPRDKLHVVTNGIDEHFFQPRDRMMPLRDTYGWGDDIVVLYIGTHGLSQGLSHVIEAAGQLRGRRDMRFVFAGEGAERAMLMRRAREKGLQNVQFLPMQPKEHMPAFYAAADICLVPLKRGPYFRCNIPSKMLEIMACARPIVLGAEGQAREVLQAADAGIAVEPENPAAYAGAIATLADDPALRRQFGESGRAHVVVHYSRRKKAAQYIALLERLTGKT
ncbi:MAG: glycosyltransferase family 4 protein [Candidatus Hydrogenedentota bacterium]